MIRVGSEGVKKGLPTIVKPLLTESERFELSRRLPGLPHFECGPFSQTWVRLHFETIGNPVS